MLFDFGQPTDGIIQTAFVVADREPAMAEFCTRLRAGPWTVLRNVNGRTTATGASQRRRGRTSRSGSPGTCSAN